MNALSEYLGPLQTALSGVDVTKFDAVADRLHAAYDAKQTIFICGNGGSAATASHMVNDLVKGVAWNHAGEQVCTPMRVVGLADCVPLMTAVANDTCYENMFAAQLLGLGEEGDVLIAISGSGNSGNIVEAVRTAKDLGMTVIGFTGYDGGKLGQMADIHLHVPCHSMPHVEDVHLVINHALVETLKKALRPKTTSAT